MALLEIRDLHASVEGAPILKGVDLVVEPGSVHVLMGPNGTGKSTLANVLAGHKAYETTRGEVLFQGRDLFAMTIEERALAGLFLAFQHPVEIPGVAMTVFLKAAINARRRAQGLEEIEPAAYLSLVRERAKALGIAEEMLKRPLNVGFSGGEKKRADMLQMSVLEPSFAILDETDSGLDVDALRIVAGGVNALRSSERSFLLITHYQRLLDAIVPDVVHVFAGGRIVRSGGADLARELEAKGYADYLGAAAQEGSRTWNAR